MLVLVRVVVAIPGETQLLDAGVVDLGQRAEALLAVAAAIGGPQRSVVGALLEALLVTAAGPASAVFALLESLPADMLQAVMMLAMATGSSAAPTLRMRFDTGDPPDWYA